MTAAVIDHPMRATLERAHQQAQTRRFEVRTVSRDGTVRVEHPVGGSSCGHAADAIEHAGEGSRISVRALP